jgi:hypothetical protein
VAGDRRFLARPQQGGHAACAVEGKRRDGENCHDAGFSQSHVGSVCVVLGPFAKEDAEAQLPTVQRYVADAFIKAGS